MNRGNITGHYVPTPNELRAWADNPAANGIVPVYPVTLRNIAAELERLQAKAETCLWSQDEDEDMWETECGRAWQFTEGGPVENEMTYCHGCGKRVIHE